MATATKPETPATSPTHPTFTITVPRSVLREALGKLLSVIPTAKVSIPVLACVLIDVPDTIEALAARLDDKAPRPERVRLTGTNLDAIVSLAVPMEVTGAGRVALPAKRLADFAASLPDGASITITVSGLTAKVRSGRSTLALSGMDPAEFPTLPEIARARTVAIVKGAFLDATTRAVRFASKQESRPILNSVRLAVEGALLTAVATDGYSLARFPIGDAGPNAPTAEALLPNMTVPSFARLFADVPDDVTLDFAADHHRARLTAGGVSIQFRLIEGPYPNYNQVIPRDVRHTIVCEREALSRAIKRVALASGDQRQVQMTIGPAAGTGAPELRLCASSESGGTADDVVAVERHDRAESETADSLTIGGNATYLTTALDSLRGERVTITLTTPERPFLFHVTDQAVTDLTLTLVMPQRIV
jgi:DNA polymerase-3 subunit beta